MAWNVLAEQLAKVQPYLQLNWPQRRRIPMVLCGSLGVGKRTMIQQHCDGRTIHHKGIAENFSEVYESLYGARFIGSWHTHSESPFKLDNQGQLQVDVDMLVSSIGRATEAMVFVYDSTDIKSLEDLRKIYFSLDASKHRLIYGMNLFVVANKLSLAEQPEDSQGLVAQGRAFAADIEATFIQRSGDHDNKWAASVFSETTHRMVINWFMNEPYNRHYGFDELCRRLRDGWYEGEPEVGLHAVCPKDTNNQQQNDSLEAELVKMAGADR